MHRRLGAQFAVLLLCAGTNGFQLQSPLTARAGFSRAGTVHVCKGMKPEQTRTAYRRLSRSTGPTNLKGGVKDTGDQFAALALPLQPDPFLSPQDVITCLMRGLKWNDVPKQNTGLERCFNFADAMCRAAVGGHSSNAAGVSLDNFIRYAQNPVFSKMVSCQGFEVEPINVLPGSETRGALATQVLLRPRHVPIPPEPRAPTRASSLTRRAARRLRARAAPAPRRAAMPCAGGDDLPRGWAHHALPLDAAAGAPPAPRRLLARPPVPLHRKRHLRDRLSPSARPDPRDAIRLGPESD
jgi:hypothetical protein